MPNLENLRKQAKQYLRWHRERYYPVAARIRAVLPRFEGASDTAILASDFRLTDAQELVAREMGFAGWEALLSGVDAMSDIDTKTAPVLTSAEPQLFVADVQSSCAFYKEMLGFKVAFIYGDPPFYAQVARDAVRLNLRMVEEPVFAGDIRRREGLLSVSITLATAGEIKELFLTYQAAGVLFHQRLKKEPWGARTFIVSDIDENLILFASPAE